MRWLNGDDNEVVDLHDESIRFLGELSHPPAAVLSRSEAILVSDRQRNDEDLDKKLKLIRQERALQRQIDELTVSAVEIAMEYLVSFFIDSSISTCSHEMCIHSEKVKAQQIISVRFRKWNQRRKLVLKWSHYLRTDHFATLAAIKLRRAAKLIAEAAPHANKFKFPSSFLLSQSQLTDLQTYDSVFVKDHDLSSFSIPASSSLLRAQVRVGEAIGTLQRGAFVAHADLSRALTVERTTRAIHVNPKDEKADASGTRALTPVFQYFRRMAAPLSVFANDNKIKVQAREPERGFEDRESKINCLIANSLRFLFNPRNTHPVFSSVGADLSTVVSATQQSQLADDWGITTKHCTGYDFLSDIVDHEKARTTWGKGLTSDMRQQLRTRKHYKHPTFHLLFKMLSQPMKQPKNGIQ